MLENGGQGGKNCYDLLNFSARVEMHVTSNTIKILLFWRKYSYAPFCPIHLPADKMHCKETLISLHRCTGMFRTDYYSRLKGGHQKLFYYFWVVFVEVVIPTCLSCLDWQCSVRPFKHLAAETSLKMLFCRLVVLHLPSEHIMTYNQLASRLNPCFWCSSSNLLLSLERAI